MRVVKKERREEDGTEEEEEVWVCRKKGWREERGSEDNQITAVEAMEEEGQK